MAFQAEEPEGLDLSSDKIQEHIDAVHETTAQWLEHFVERLLPMFAALHWSVHLAVFLFFLYRLLDQLLHPDYPCFNLFKPLEYIVRLPFRVTGLDRVLSLLLGLVCCTCIRKRGGSSASMFKWD